MNAAVIGPDPNVLKPGTVLYVPEPLRDPPSNCAVYDHGPSMYANGTVSGNVYTVAAGDTWYSVGVRFGLPWETISARERRRRALSRPPAHHPGPVQQHRRPPRSPTSASPTRRPARTCPPPSPSAARARGCPRATWS